MRCGIVGYTGRMGKEIGTLLREAGHDLVLTADAAGESVRGEPRVIFDFSLPGAWPGTRRLCLRYNAALVLGTTGFDGAQLEQARELGRTVPVVQSANFGIGINLLAMIMRDYSCMLADWELEISEAHHNKKKDAPSGTALTLMEAAGRACPAHSLRLGNLPGDHAAHYALGDELLTFTHRAVSRNIFAGGALKAAEFALRAGKGYYSFQDVLRAGAC